MKIYLNKVEYEAFIKLAESAQDDAIFRELYHTTAKRFAIEELLNGDPDENKDYLPDAAIEVYQE